MIKLKQCRKSHFLNNKECFLVGLSVCFLFGINGSYAQSIPERWKYAITVEERVEEVKEMPEGPFVGLGKERILSASSASGQEVMISENNGKTWEARRIFNDSKKYQLGSTA